tara:strand:- start:125 stop:610 length:486 start_codon:yes stop_codon:yes gene_type:complete
MKLNRLVIAIFFLFFINNIVLAQFNYKPNQVNNSVQLTGEDYITGEDGVPRMSVNVWGHVKYPGTYLVYDQIDFLTCLSMAGGPLTGAKLSEVSIISKDGSVSKIDIEQIISNNKSNSIVLKPYDTIYIDETLGNYLLARSNVINILLQITNLILISTNNK